MVFTRTVISLLPQGRPEQACLRMCSPRCLSVNARFLVDMGPPKRKADRAVDKTPTKKAKVVQRYIPNYQARWPCLVKSKKGDSHVFCTVCGSDFSCSSGGAHDCKRHIESTRHKQNASLKEKVPSVSSYIKEKDAEKSEERKITRAEAYLCDFLIDHNLPFSSADTLTRMVRYMFPDSKIAAGIKCCRNKTTAMVKEMAALHMSDLATRMKHQPFSIATDGGNDADKKQFPLVVRTLGSGGLVNSELLALPVCPGSATGENIFKLMDSEFKAQQIPWENCISFGCDNANVMTGCHKGVIAFVRTKQPNVHMAGCCLHLVHIAAKKGAACLPPVEDILVDIFYYFNKSVNRQTELKGLQELYDVEQRKMLKHGCTRWLSIGRCLERLLKNWEPLIHFFRDEKAKTKGIGSHATSKAEGIHLFLRSPTNKLFCHFLSYTLKVYDQVLVQLQAEKPMVHSLRANLVRLVEDLFSRFMEPGAVFGVDIGKVQFEQRSKQKDDTELLIGTKAREMLAQPTKFSLREKRISEFFGAVRCYFQTVCRYLLDKLPLADQVLVHATVANPGERMVVLASALDHFLDTFPALIPKDATKDSIKEEFVAYQTAAIEDAVDNDERTDQVWKNIGVKYPRYLKLSFVMRGILTIPHSSAGCERVFSSVRKNCTAQRASMLPETTEALLVCKSRPGHFLDKEREHSSQTLESLKSAYYMSLQQ